MSKVDNTHGHAKNFLLRRRLVHVGCAYVKINGEMLVVVIDVLAKVLRNRGCVQLQQGGRTMQSTQAICYV